MTIANSHPFDIADLLVRDTIPLGDDDAGIRVTLRKPEGLARATDGEEIIVGAEGEAVRVRWGAVENGFGGEKDGMYEWVCGVPAGKKVVLETVWEVQTPESFAGWKEVEDPVARAKV